MIDGLKPYSAMKDSGVPWLGNVPEHWEVRKLRHVLERVTMRNRPDLPLLSVVREKGVILRDTANKDENHNFIPDDLSNYKVVRIGQFAMNKMKAWQGSYGLSHHDGIVSPAYFVFGVSGLDGKFFHTAIRSKIYVPFFARASDGIRVGQWDLAVHRMRENPFFVPPLPEQAAIVRFIDHADGLIRRYILAKQKLVKLLEEQRQAIIHRAVTRGLDPNVRLKPSGVGWLGEVPEHWDIQSAKQVSKVFIPQRDKPELNEREGLPWITPEYIGAKQVGLPVSFVSQDAAKSSGSRSVPAGSVIASCVGRFGISSINEIPVIINQQLQAYLPTSIIDARFLRYCVQVAKPYFEMEGNSTTLAYVNRQGFADLPLACPPRPEQEAIVSWIEEEESRVNGAALNANREIILLREYRTRLIADVVTGKLDVREAASRLPQEAPEVELLDEIDDLPQDESAAEDGELEAADAL
jgi:type I restriction enzyme S subunit